MYYILYPLLYLFSLLPFFILYRISDFFYVIVYHIFGYRKDVVMDNLAIAFPEKTLAEKASIAKQFYKNFIDTLIETIKLLSISDSEFDKRCTMDFSDVRQMAAKGKNIQIHCGHQMNWEYGNWRMAKGSPIPFIGIYKKITNKALDKIFYDLRSRQGTVMVSTTDFKNNKETVLSGQYSLGLAADQNGDPNKSYWLNFFSKSAPFVKGPGIGAVKNNTAIIFANFVKRKRGHYHFATQLMVENAADFTPEQLTLQYRDMLEAAIRKTPDNYLWSHRRWRHGYRPADHINEWIDSTQPLS